MMLHYLQLVGFFLVFTLVKCYRLYDGECTYPTNGEVLGIKVCDDEVCLLKQKMTHTVLFHFMPRMDFTNGSVTVRVYRVGLLRSFQLWHADLCSNVTPGCPLNANQNYTISYNHRIPIPLQKDLNAFVVDVKDENRTPIVCAKYSILH